MGTVSWVFSWSKVLQRKAELHNYYITSPVQMSRWYTHLSSLATSLCWESSSISGRLVIMSRWTSSGATDTSSMSFVASSCKLQDGYNHDYRWRQATNLKIKTVESSLWRRRPPFVTEITTLLSTTRSSHLSWLMMMRGTLSPPSTVLSRMTQLWWKKPWTYCWKSELLKNKPVQHKLRDFFK